MTLAYSNSMTSGTRIASWSLVIIFFISTYAYPQGKHNNAKTSESRPAILWQNPRDVRNRNLLRGPGGGENFPQGPFKFLNEDLDGTNPKFDVLDRNGVRWKVKLGVEARPEVAASRLLWAAGYFTRENYYLPVLRVDNMPRRLKRGQELVSPDGSIHQVRLRRESGIDRIDIWKWRHNPFTGTREMNGLRVMMAVLNNGDLKDVNNGVFETQSGRDVYMVSDLGASFSEHVLPINSKGNLDLFRRSRFIIKVRPNTVDFDVHVGPDVSLRHPVRSLKYMPSYVWRRKLRWIGKDIPRSDVAWISGILAQLSPNQVGDAFRAAGYSPDEVQGFTEVLRARIALLRQVGL